MALQIFKLPRPSGTDKCMWLNNKKITKNIAIGTEPTYWCYFSPWYTWQPALASTEMKGKCKKGKNIEKPEK